MSRIIAGSRLWRRSRRTRAHRRTWRRLSALLLSAALIAAGCASVPPAPSAQIGTPMDDPLSQTLLTLPLTDAQGRPEPLSSFDGKVMVISDMMTLCQETCPIDTATLVQTARAVQKAGLGDKVEFVSITIDPRRDTPAMLAAYRTLFDPAPKDWVLLTGTPDTVTKLWRAFAIYIQRVPEGNPPAVNWATGKPLTYDVDHSDEVFFVDTAHTDRFVLEGPAHVSTTTTVPATLRSFLDAQGKQNLDDPDATAWTEDQALQVISWLTGTTITA